MIAEPADMFPAEAVTDTQPARRPEMFLIGWHAPTWPSLLCYFKVIFYNTNVVKNPAEPANIVRSIPLAQEN